ncbi:L10-interacting MYB domain-containing protein [Camellia lanceoleosa]|uniref:L10-interacting MYB domain-containing protein n=1 Tax=Camellia lanceoleosa TaxID=1840588 RepID=A0ACC0H5Q9_9ERIC|nr:L10-interacting MYB domain-containing protein [Camellia lanceoleosa]
MTGYKNIANQILDKTGLLHSAKQMKNKFDNLKKDWVAWQNLENANHGLTGLGYDHETSLFTVPDHWRAKMQAMNNRCVKFKTKPLEHLELMEQVYSGAVATGKHTWTPTEVCDDAATTTNANEDSGMEPLSASTPPQLGHDTVRENVVDSSLFNDSPLQSAADGSANAKRRKQPMLGIVASSMENLVAAVSKQSRELKTTQYVVTGNGENTVGDCLARLMSMPGLEPNGKLFSFVCGIMDSPENRDIIMAFSMDYIANQLI